MRWRRSPIEIATFAKHEGDILQHERDALRHERDVLEEVLAQRNAVLCGYAGPVGAGSACAPKRPRFGSLPGCAWCGAVLRRAS